jgi:hypothetical protein
METITYIEAGKLLNRSYEAIKSSVKMGILSKYVTRDKRASLIKEQVLLFQGKTRVSLKSLTQDEKAEWDKYDSFAKSGVDLDTAETKESIEEIKDTVEGLKSFMGSIGQMFTEMAKKQYKYDTANRGYL